MESVANSLWSVISGQGSGFPVLDFVDEFVIGVLGDRGGEGHRADLPFDLEAQGACERKELAGGEGHDIAFGEFGLDFAQLFAQGIDAVVDP